MKQRISIALTLLCISVMLYQCTGCEKSKEKIKTADETTQKVDSLGLEDKSRPEWSEIEQSLRTHLEAQANDDFESYLDYVNPKMFIGKDKQAIIEAMEGWAEKGLHNRTENVEVVKISPLVSDDTSDYAVVWFDGDMIVDFDENFQGDPKGFIMQLNSKHGEGNVVYDSLDRKFIVDRLFLMYAQRVGESPKWTFLEEGFYAGLHANAGLMDRDILLQLKKYE